MSILGQIVSKDKYPKTFSPQMEAIVFINLQIFFATRAILKIGEYFIIGPLARKGLWPLTRGYWPVALEGEGSNCFSITQLVGPEKAMINLAIASWENTYLKIKQTKEWRKIAPISILDYTCW